MNYCFLRLQVLDVHTHPLILSLCINSYLYVNEIVIGHGMSR